MLSISEYLPVFLKLLIFCVKMLRLYFISPNPPIPSRAEISVSWKMDATDVFKVLSINKWVDICIFCLIFLFRKPLFHTGIFYPVLRYSIRSVLYCLQFLAVWELRTLYRCSACDFGLPENKREALPPLLLLSGWAMLPSTHL